MDMAGLLLRDIQDHVRTLEAHPQPPVPLAEGHARESFRH
jgi:hypothetical protein